MCWRHGITMKRENIINYMGNTSTSKHVCSISAAFANHVVQKVSHVPQLLDGLLVQWTHGPMDSGMCLRHLEKMRLSFHCGNKHVRNCKHNLQVKTLQVDLRNYHSRIFKIFKCNSYHSKPSCPSHSRSPASADNCMARWKSSLRSDMAKQRSNFNGPLFRPKKPS